MKHDLTDREIVDWNDIHDIARADTGQTHVLVSPVQSDHLTATWGLHTPAPSAGWRELWWRGVLIEAGGS